MEKYDKNDYGDTTVVKKTQMQKKNAMTVTDIDHHNMLMNNNDI